MKLILIINLTLLLQVSASVYSQKTLLDYNVEDQTVKDILKDIESKTGFRFFYNDDYVFLNNKVDLKVKNSRVEKILDKLLDDTDISYKVLEDNLVVLLPKIEAQQITVSGNVTDMDGTPLPGVNIIEKGTSNGSVTDLNGNYSISVSSPNAVLSFSYVGFLSEEMEVANQTTINITLIEDIQSLDEVVVIGYGSVRKSDLTSAIAKVDGDILESRPVSRIDQALQGQLAGVHVQQSGGRPGKSSVIHVRGVGSISAGNEPLYVVDGFPVNKDFFANMSLDNVESIEILKDAASAAIYGSRGSNGVVLVTTKRGEKGQELKLDFNMHTGISNIERKIPMLSAEEYVMLHAEGVTDAYIQSGGDLSVLPMERPYSYRYNQDWVNNPSSIPDYTDDYYDALLRTGKQQKYQLTGSGSTENSRYIFSGEYFKEDGIVKNSDYTRYSFHTGVDSDITKFLTVGFSLSPYYAVDNDPDTEGKDSGVISHLVAAIPYLEPRLGYWGETDRFNDVNIQHYFPVISLPKVEHLVNKTITARMQANTYAEFTILPGLKFKTTFGANFSDYRRDRFENQIIRRTSPPRGNSWSSQTLNWLNENTLSFNKEINGTHHVGGVLGFTNQKETYKAINLNGSDMPNDLVTTLNAATTFTGSTHMSEWSLLSYLARANYSYSNKYMLSASMRTDGSSRFGANNRWGWFPSISAGWRVDQENFMESASNWLSLLKLRSSWGKTGNNNIGDYRAISTLGSSAYIFGADKNILAGLSPDRKSNPDLGWEIKESFDVGLDLGFFNNRISFTADYYQDHTSDLLLNVLIPSITGFTTELKNIGEVENKGMEFELRTQNLTGVLKWSTNLNFSTNKNKVVKLGPDDAPIFDGDWFDAGQVITAVGYSIGTYYALNQTGVYNTQEEIDATPHWAGTRPGDVKIEDYSGPDGVPDGVIDSYDRKHFKSNIPTYYFGITNQFSYKSFDLSIFINGLGGNQILNSYGRELDAARQVVKNHFAHWANRWKSPDDPGDGMTPRISASPTGANAQYTTRNLFKGDYVRLKNITLGYNLPTKFVNKMSISNARIYVQGENLYTWDYYTVGFTPEVDLSHGNVTRAGRDYGTYPSVKTFLFGLNISF